MSRPDEHDSLARAIAASMALSETELRSVLTTLRAAKVELTRRRFIINCYTVMLGYLAAVAQGTIGIFLVAVAIACVLAGSRLWTRMRQ